MICRAGWLTSWNQDCWGNYQQPQICRWHHPNGRKWKWTKEPLVEVKEESIKAGLKLNIKKTKILASRSHHFMANSWGNTGNSERFYFPGLQNYCGWWLQPWNSEQSYDKLRQHIQKQRYNFANKGPSNWIYDFSISHVWMWELNHKEGWVPKNWCFWTVVLEKTLESSLDSKEIKLVNRKGNQIWIFIERTDTMA